MKQKIKILLLEDTATDAELIVRELHRGKINSDILLVNNKVKFTEALEVFSPDIILSDYSLPFFNAREALQLVKAANINIPFILITSTISYEFAAELMKEGMHDYIIKDRLQRLPSAVLNSIEKHRLEIERQIAHEQLVFHFENTPLGFIEYDQYGFVKLWSKRAEQIFGWKEKEFIKRRRTGFSQVYEEDLPIATQSANDLITGVVEKNNVQHRNITKDGRVIWCEWFNSVLRDKDGNVITIMSLVQDITQRKQAEENLRKSETSLKEAQAIANIGNWEFDLEHNKHIWSEELYKIFGVRKRDISPSTEAFISFIHPADVDDAKARMDLSSRNFENSSFDFRFIRRDGVIRCGYSEWRFEVGSSMKPVRLYGIVQDVTDRKTAEIERIQMVNDLMLRNRDLEQFAYIVSHNLRAPAANILGALNILNDTNLTTQERDMLNQGLRSSVVGLDNVIKDLNQILQAKIDINEPKELVSFSALIEDVKASVKHLTDVESTEIRYDFSEIDNYLTFKSYLHSIFYNLIFNSIKYRRQEVPCRIVVKSHLINGKVQLIFKDNGMGIDLKTKGDQVFGLYKRFHPEIEGKGMGLFMVKTQVETIGGKISIKSEVNKGTEFKIEFAK